ncbi:MAG TPA: hypothetical protein VJJ75_02040 [Candidatus Nanoarchaeia archaeon]|nr:hypothetical protein [Candidatus Nanoarchaeia archaeon]
MQFLLYIAPVLSFIVALLSMPLWIRYLKRIGLVVPDKNKKDQKKLIPISGGIVVLCGMLAGIMLYIFIQIFYYDKGGQGSLLYMFAAVTTVMLITFIGFLDDLIVNKHIGESTGLKQWQKPILTLLTAVPLMVVKAGTTFFYVPFIPGIDRLDVGLMYPLLFVPIGIVGASNMINMLGGLNGLEAGMGLIYMGSMSLYAYANERYAAAAIAAIVFAALFAFWLYNKFPARIFPGDSLTYLLGASLVSVAILGNLEKAALILSVPFFVEFLLKWRSRFKAKSYGIYKNGKIMSYYEKIYSIPHIWMRAGKFTEKQVVVYCMLIELFFAGLIWIV